MRQPDPRRPVGLRPGLEIDLHRRRRRHHRRTGGAGLTGGEELFHRAIPVTRIHPLGRPQRVGAEQHQTESGLGERGAQHGPVGGHRGDRGKSAVHRRPGQFHRTAGFDGDQTSAGKVGHTSDDLGQLVPLRAAQRLSKVEAVGFDLQAHPADRTVRQTVGADTLRGTVGAGQLGFAGVDWVRFIQVGRDGCAGVGHTNHPFPVRDARRLHSIFQTTLTKSRDFRVTRR